MNAYEIIEKAQLQAMNAKYGELGHIGMSFTEFIGYKEGLISAYQHALEMFGRPVDISLHTEGDRTSSQMFDH